MVIQKNFYSILVFSEEIFWHNLIGNVCAKVLGWTFSSVPGNKVCFTWYSFWSNFVQFVFQKLLYPWCIVDDARGLPDSWCWTSRLRRSEWNNEDLGIRFRQVDVKGKYYFKVFGNKKIHGEVKWRKTSEKDNSRKIPINVYAIKTVCILVFGNESVLYFQCY